MRFRSRFDGAHGKSRGLAWAAAWAAFVVLVLAESMPALAMPPFAQAYGANCTLCHSQVPTLNSYGRSVQRSGYAILDHQVLKRSLPVWVGVNPTFDSQSSGGKNFQSGNVAIHAVGLVGDFSYHIQQWLVQNNAPGGLDTAWFSYNGLFHHFGHLFAGKIETPAPSPFSQWSDLSGFASAEMIVGEHQYQLDNNRWGSRLAYVHRSLDVEAGWLGAGGDLGGTSDFSNDTDKTFQWKVAHVSASRTSLEVGAFGSRGSFPLQEGGTDQYWSAAAYVQRDPQPHFPGIFAIYQDTFDRNPGNGLGPAAGNAATLELYQTFFHGNALVGARTERTNDGLGNHVQSGNLDFEYQLARFVHIYLERSFAQGNTPGFKYEVWWTTPLESVK